MNKITLLLGIGLLLLLVVSCTTIDKNKLSIISDTQCNSDVDCINLFESANIPILDASLIKCNNDNLCEVKDTYIPQGEEQI